MDRTPRLRSAFPETPRHEPGSIRSSPVSITQSPSARPTGLRKSVLRNAAPPPQPSTSTIPADILTEPQQRAWALGVYLALLAWKLYDWSNTTAYKDESTWLFSKWTTIDAIYFTSISILQIEWLQWSFATVIVVWIAHTFFDWVLMYNMGLLVYPLLAWLGRTVYNREISLTERRVDPGSIIHNSSIILGKQIINFLPEGLAILNPDMYSYCLDSAHPVVQLPILINQTSPKSIELFRYNLDSEEVDTVIIGAKQINNMKKAADKTHDKNDKNTPRLLRYPVSRKGFYTLEKVIDRSGSEVRRRGGHGAAVVVCPRASISSSARDKCTGDISGLSMTLEGVPPFQVKYSKQINSQQASSITQIVQPADTEPREESSQVIVDPRRPHMGWTRSTSVSVDINESLNTVGTWFYTIEEIEDGLKNKIVFHDDSKKAAASHHIQTLAVHRRPKVKLEGCDGEHYLKVAREDSIRMPIEIPQKNALSESDWPLTVNYTFSPKHSPDGTPAVEQQSRVMSSAYDVPGINKAGRYDIVSVTSPFCLGEVVEPSSCLLENPERPGLAYQKEEIFDRCAGRPIGMTLDFDLTGTPPFEVWYEVSKDGGKSSLRSAEFPTLRGQIEIRERDAGLYKYTLVSIADEIYNQLPVRSEGNTFEQRIRPPAAAVFKTSDETMRACLGQPVKLDIHLQGEQPWDLEYEIVHGGKRKKHTVHSEAEDATIELPPQSDGGEYTMILSGVQDSSRCRTALKEERHIEVRPEQPQASFGDHAGRRFIEALEGKNPRLPIRLKGVPPFHVEIQHPSKGVVRQTFKDLNSFITADTAGTYQIMSVHDSCPGVVDPKADQFEIAWIRRPELRIKADHVTAQGRNVFHKEAVCQGMDSSLGLTLSGHPPYHVRYHFRAEPMGGKPQTAERPLTIGDDTASISLDTSRAGKYTYTFNELSDGRYAPSKKHFQEITVKQEVYAPPTAQFVTPGKVYGYCRDESEAAGDMEYEHIPITLSGVAPFSIDIAVHHHSVSAQAEIVRVRDIPANTYSWPLSRSSLGLGAHTVQIRAVRDARGCESLIESNPSTVRINISQPPKIRALDTRTDYCVGDHLTFSLSGQAPFEILYTFQGRARKAPTNSNEFRRISDEAGELVITSISDSTVGTGGKCRARDDIHCHIHAYPTVRISHGKTLTTNIHEGGEVEMIFEFTGTPPFEFTYTRSENVKKGKVGRVLETKHDTSQDFVKIVRANDEGEYEVVSIKDRYCSFSKPGVAKLAPGRGPKLLPN